MADMVLYPFNGQLNANEIYQSIYNMIISQTVFANPIKGTYSLADKFRKEGSLYGDTKLFYSVQIGEVVNWTNDSEAANLLALNRPADPKCQAVDIDVFKMIWLTVDNFLSKRAWGTESSFSQFNSVILGTMRDTKRVYEATMVNAFIGTHTAGDTYGLKQNVEVEIPEDTGTVGEDTVVDNEALARLEANAVAKAMADLLVDVQDVSTDYNDLGYLRSYDASQLMFIWNADWYNKITKVDLPTIFHKDGLVDKLGENVLPARYFGDIDSATTSKAGARALKDMTLTISGTAKYFRAGDVIPTGTTVTANSTYVPNDDIICKIVVPEGIQYMSAFETQTEFYNPRSLTNTHYLIFGHSDLDKSVLKEFPFITVKVKAST